MIRRHVQKTFTLESWLQVFNKHRRSWATDRTTVLMFLQKLCSYVFGMALCEICLGGVRVSDRAWKRASRAKSGESRQPCEIGWFRRRWRESFFFCLWGVRISAFSIQSKWRRKGVREMSTSIEASRCVCHCLEYTIGLNAVCTCWYTHVFLSDILVLIFCYYVALLTLSVSLSYHYTCNPSVTTGLTTHTNQWHRFSYGNAWI